MDITKEGSTTGITGVDIFRKTRSTVKHNNNYVIGSAAMDVLPSQVLKVPAVMMPVNNLTQIYSYSYRFRNSKIYYIASNEII